MARLSLKEIQDRFQRAIMAGDGTVLGDIPDSPRESRNILLGVYQHAYTARLMEFVGNDYEVLHTLLGDEQFFALAAGYVAATPSNNQNARWYGARMPAYLRETEPWSGQPVLAEIATFEMALNDVFDAREAPILRMEDMAQVAPEDWPDLTFTPQPACIRLDLRTNAVGIWNALNSDEAPPAPGMLAEPARMVVYRQDFQSMFREMPAEEAMAWDEAANGVRFSVLCEMLATYGGDDEAPVRAAGFLSGWIAGQMLVRTAPEPAQTETPQMADPA